MELGLFEEAAEKFTTRVVQQKEESSHALASYGQGLPFLYISQRDAMDGKAGAAFDYIKRAIDGCLSSSSKFVCAGKLVPQATFIH